MSRNAPPPVQSREVVRFDPKQAYADIEAALREKEDAIVATLGPTIPRERFMAVALQAVTRSPRLLECTPASIIKALRDAAELGLEPSGLMGSAYLVPYRNKQSGRYEAQLIPGYRGLIDLARRSGELVTMEAHVVREKDTFEFEFGTMQHLTHRPWLNLTGERETVLDENTGELGPGRLLDAGPYVAFYAFARLTSGETQFDVMTVPEVDAIRRRSKAGDDGPWVTDYVEMGRKTVVKRLVKFLPLSATDLTRALEIEDAAEGGAEPTATVTAPARAALQAAFTTPAETAPEAEPDEGLTEGATAEPEAQGDPFPAASEDVSPGEDPAPFEPLPGTARVPDPAFAACGNVSPYGDGEACTLPFGHPNNHRAASKASW
jgi:recombination protein RecT